MRIDVVRDDRTFAEMRPEWDGLLAASRQDGPFLRHSWLSAWWDSFGSGELSVVTARAAADGRLLGVLPLFTTRMGRLSPVRAARFLGDAEVGSTGLTAFALPEAEREVFSRFGAYVRYGDHGWDMLDLRFMDPAHAFFGQMAVEPGARPGPVCGTCPITHLPGDFDSYIASLAKRKRAHFRRTLRRAEEAGAELEVVRDPDDLPEAVGDLIRLHETRMRSVIAPGYRLSPEFRRFTAATTSTLLAEDRLRLMFYRLAGRRSAVAYLFRYGDTIYGEQSGFDADEAAAGLLRPLKLHGVRMAIEEGCTRYDQLLGDQHHKSEWGVDEVRRLSRIRVYGHSLAGSVRRGRDGVAEWAERRRERASDGQASEAEAEAVTDEVPPS